MKKYGLDEGQLYVETCTLLEPNNFIPSWVSDLFLVTYIMKQEAGDEEKKEVSLALKKLRKQYDDIHKMTVQKEYELELIKVSNFAQFLNNLYRKEFKKFQRKRSKLKGILVDQMLKQTKPKLT